VFLVFSSFIYRRVPDLSDEDYQNQITYLMNLFSHSISFVKANKILDSFNVLTFFKNQQDYQEFLLYIKSQKYWIDLSEERNREWGDIQTPLHLVDIIYQILLQLEFTPNIIIEPTFGDGNFILFTDSYFPKIELIYGIEISKIHKWNFIISLLIKLSDKTKLKNKLKYMLYTEDFFKHDFSDIEKISNSAELLIIGNPPWITVSELSSLNSKNIPMKFNKKQFRGIESITGKSNFDISESIIVQLINLFSEKKGKIALLCKNIVINNILKDLLRTQYKIGNIVSYSLDLQKEFGKKCDASLLILDLNSRENYGICEVRDIYYPNNLIKKIGWFENKFVSNIEKYTKTNFLDGKSSFIWRQGIKHDCSKVLELKHNEEGKLFNKLGESVEVEEELIYPLMKSSDLREFNINSTNRRILLTQMALNQDTLSIEMNFPKAWKYLQNHSQYFNRRKSIVYKNNLPFSIFGVGKYAFSPFKVAISGMYKKPKFAFINEIDNKPVIFDDTCYYLSFNSYKEAVFTCSILNSRICLDFLDSITFIDSKRPYTKEVLMRINLQELSNQLNFTDLKKIWNQHCFNNRKNLSEKDYYPFKNKVVKMKD